MTSISSSTRLPWSIGDVLVRPYALDKVLHNDLLCDAILRDEHCRFIFLLRQPARAIQSHIRHIIAIGTRIRTWGRRTANRPPTTITIPAPNG